MNRETDANQALSAIVAIDTGGTFTDLSAALSDGQTIRLKVASTPDDPSRAVLSAIDALRARIGKVLHITEVRHGTTVATNALLERRGGAVVLITTAGFEDLMILRRQDRPDLYALHPEVEPPLVPAQRCIGVQGRLGPDGSVERQLEDPDKFVQRHRALLASADAVAVCLLHSYADGRHERAVEGALRRVWPQLPVTTSHGVAPVVREWERCSTAVVNAYVAPVMRRYLARLADTLAPMPLHVMSSAGGLLPVSLAASKPVLTALSGPAGGVAGAWAAGRRTGRSRLLTLDMGGTSTDVSVVQGRLESTDEGALGCHPLRVPLLPIETVGAGGGSIAFIDSGGVLRVGPRSAGAVPGPACYGHGGPDAEATVTDAHVVLGRLPALLGGEMRLHPQLARAAVARLAARLKSTVQETAKAIVSIVAATMARACKRVSMQRGIDPRHLVLVSFGGAGGLHACELADELGCQEVLVPAGAGVLSAEGIAGCRPQADLTVTVMRACAQVGQPQLAKLIGQQRAEVVAQLRAQWPVHEGSEATVSVWLDLRYVGQSYSLAVAHEAVERLGVVEAFAAEHAHRYGYTLSDRDVELVTIRASAMIGSSQQRTSSGAPRGGAATVGPCALASYGNTLWIAQGWTATPLQSGDIVCVRNEDHRLVGAESTGMGLQLEIHRQRMASIAEQMGAVLMSAAFSANIKERKDYSCALFDGRGRMICHAAHIPVHLGSTPMSVAAALQAVPMRPQVDVVLNDPFAGGTHLPDVTVVTPVFVDAREDKPAFVVANRAHHADVGGIAPGSMPAPFAADGTIRELTIDEEGIRLPPTVIDDAVRARFAAASRTPAQRLGDLHAQEAANRAGAQLLHNLVQELGVAAVDACNEALLDYAERRMRAVIAALPDGTFYFEDHLDDDGLGEVPVPIAVTLQVDGDVAIVDLRDCAPSSRGPLNAVRAIAVSATFYVFRALAGAFAGEDGAAMPANAGMMRPITVLTRRGSLLDAQPPAAVSSGNVETSQRVVDVLLGALAQAAPHCVPAASCGSMNNVLMGGELPRPWVHYETLAGGAGGGPLGDGATAVHTHMTNTLNTPVEALEHAFPIRIDSYRVDRRAPDGDVDAAGGDGVVRTYRFIAAAEVTLITERRRIAPWSLGAAPPGQVGRNVLISACGRRQELAGKCTVSLQAGDALEVRTPGGGNFRRQPS